MRIVGNLAADKLCTGSNAVEALHAIQIVTCRDARHVGTVCARVEEEIERGLSTLLPDVGGKCQVGRSARGRPAKGFARGEVVVHRLVVGQRAIAIGVDDHDPAVGRMEHHDCERVVDVTIGIEVTRVRVSHRQFADGAAIPWPVCVERPQVRKSTQTLAPDHDGVAGGIEPRQRDLPLAREIPQVQDLGIAGARGTQARNARVDAAVEDRNEDAAAIKGRMLLRKLGHAGRCQRHPALLEGDVRWKDRRRKRAPRRRGRVGGRNRRSRRRCSGRGRCGLGVRGTGGQGQPAKDLRRAEDARPAGWRHRCECAPLSRMRRPRLKLKYAPSRGSLPKMPFTRKSISGAIRAVWLLKARPPPM